MAILYFEGKLASPGNNYLLNQYSQKVKHMSLMMSASPKFLHQPSRDHKFMNVIVIFVIIVVIFFLTKDLLDLIFTALTHTNRFVRETGFNVCAALVSCGGGGE